MKNIIIDHCKMCPFYDGSDRELAICNHPKSIQRGVYNNIVDRSHFQKDPIPNWCPIKYGYLRTVRDIYDNIIEKIQYKIINLANGETL